MNNRMNDGLKATSFLWVLIGLAAACGGASTTQGSEPAKTTTPSETSGAAPAVSGTPAAATNPSGAPGREEIRAVLKDHARDLKACYDREKDRGMAYKGDTKFQVKIDAAGKVTDVKGVDVAPPAEFLSACVSDLIKNWQFPASGKPSTVTFPVTW